MTVPEKEMKDGGGTIGMTESGTGAGSAAVVENIVTMIGIGGSASRPRAMNSALHRSA
jgi:glucose-6-phosphate isomerase